MNRHGWRAVLELHVGGVVAGGRALGHPIPVRPPHAPQLSVADEADAIDLVGRVAVDNASALARLQVLALPGAEQPAVRRVGVDCPQLAQLAGADDLAGHPDPVGIGLRVSGQQLHVVAVGNRDHLLDLLQRDRHRLLHHDVLAGIGQDRRVGGVISIRRREPDRLHFGIARELLDAAIDPGVRKHGMEPFAYRGIDVGDSAEIDDGRHFHLAHNSGRAQTQPDDARPHVPVSHGRLPRGAVRPTCPGWYPVVDRGRGATAPRAASR